MTECVYILHACGTYSGCDKVIIAIVLAKGILLSVI